MKQLLSGLALALATVVTATAQSPDVKREVEIDVKDGKNVTLTGCVERYPDSTGATKFQLTKVADKEGRTHSYLLVDEEDDVEDHVGHLVEVKGKAADQEDGRIEVKTKTRVERDDAGDTRAETTQDVKGDLRGLPILDVDDVKMIRPTCN